MADIVWQDPCLSAGLALQVTAQQREMSVRQTLQPLGKSFLVPGLERTVAVVRLCEIGPYEVVNSEHVRGSERVEVDYDGIASWKRESKSLDGVEEFLWQGLEQRI